MEGKFLSDCEQTTVLADKFFLLTKTGGQDYKVGFADFINTLKQTMLKDYLKSKIGDLHINTNNKYRDQAKFNDGYLESLMLNGQTVNKKDYPELFTALGVTAESYSLPNYGQEGGCALRHVAQGSGRALNSYEADELKSHPHLVNLNLETETFNLVIPPHFHGMPDITGSFWGCGENFPVKDGQGQPVSNGNGAFWTTDSNRFGLAGGDWDNCEYHFSSHRAGVTRTDDGGSTSLPITVKIKPFSGNTVATGGSETRMKNVAVQCYIIAKVII